VSVSKTGVSVLVNAGGESSVAARDAAASASSTGVSGEINVSVEDEDRVFLIPKPNIKMTAIKAR
jgi:hypothetical protein